jgi:predicted nucleic acid-binding protein
MRIGLDTSVILRLLIGEPVAQADRARRLLDEQYSAEATGALVSDLVVSEAYFALRHHYEVPHVDAAAALLNLLRDDRIQGSGVAEVVLSDIALRESGAGLMDRLIHADYDSDMAAMVTFDKGAARLGGAQLLKV